MVDAQIGGHNMESTAWIAYDMRISRALFAAEPFERRLAGGAQIVPMRAVAAEREIQLLVGRRAFLSDEMHEQIRFGAWGGHGSSLDNVD